MKTIQKVPMMGTRTVAVLVGLAIALGIAVHTFFFIVALAIALVVALGWTLQQVQEYLCEFRMFHPYP